jgi:two-component system chemotaxis sensor kinase CheA
MNGDGPTDKALQEFLSEAQEIVESLNRDLLALDEGRAAGRYEPEVVNGAFRAVHSLKGLSGLFGVMHMTTLSHNLENLLDALRLGRTELTPAVLDLLFESVGLFTRIIAATAGRSVDDWKADASVEDFVDRLGRVAEARAPAAPELPWGGYELEPSLLSVLTEYEEHRLRENIRAGRALYRVHVAFDLVSIDKGLDELKARLKPVGEIITYLPSTASGETVSDQQIELDVVLGTPGGLAEVSAVLAGSGATVAAIPRTLAALEPARAEDRAPAAAPPSPSPSPSKGGRAAPSAPTAAAPEEAGEITLKSVAQTVRVDIRKLDTLMNIVGELAIARAGFQSLYDGIKGDRAQQELARALHHEIRALSRKLDELQAGILEVRMVPLGQVFDKLSRVVRKISRDAGKEIRLVISGADTELDKLIVEELSDPLMHVIRNAIDHGIERAEVRERAGKASVGTVDISAEQRGNHVVIVVEDDGAGLDVDRLVERALARGLVDEAEVETLTRREIYNLIFLPGVSTKDVADEMSGRGVGMDVVKTNISRLSGIIDVDSEPGQGTRLTITLPITLAIIQALVVRAAGRTFAMPLNSVLESLLVAASDIATIEKREVMTLRGQTLPLARLERVFALGRVEHPPERQFVVVVGLAQHRIGLVVDELVGQQDVVIKPLGRALGGIPGIAGATELGGKKTVLVLDVAAIVEEAVGAHKDREAA